MDGKRFDQLSKSIASRSSRRTAFSRLGLGGLVGAAAGTGLSGRTLAAADKTCVLQFHAKAAAGADKNKVYEGVLSITFGPDGVINAGSYDGGGGDQPAVSGQTTGRAISFRFDYSDGAFFSYQGTAALDVSLCRGEVEGTYNGPAQSDLGTWRATLAAAGASASPTAASNGTNAAACPPDLALCDGSTPCCEAFSPYEATGLACIGGTCRCTYSCAQAGCPSTSTTTFMTVACTQNPSDLCSSLGCG